MHRTFRSGPKVADPAMRDRARELRHEAPIPERLLWGLLRGHRLGGFKFRRQHPVPPYFADFYCDAAKLVVELDGESHNGRQEQDRERQAFLERQGLRVVRVLNDDVIHRPHTVAEYILRAAQGEAVPTVRPDLPPTPAG